VALNPKQLALLKSLRLRDRAAALDALRASEQRISELQARLAQTGERVTELLKQQDCVQSGDVLSAGTLLMNALAEDKRRAEIELLMNQINSLTGDQRAAESAVRSAKEALAKAQKALDALNLKPDPAN